ncbi:MAG: glycosyltransferase family 4 protein [Gemmataceae bacterium]|nr:glycosyltransferase family 4 protein [Gemmataceae bacterium]
MRLVALVESETHVCCRYRLAAFCRALAHAGHTLDFRPLPASLLGRAGIGRDLAGYDAVVLQRKLLPGWAVALLRRRVRGLLFDFDDAVWLRDSYSAKGFHDPKRAARFRATVAACDLVVAGNRHLAAEAERLAPGRVAVIPTCVDVAKYPPATHARADAVKLVWVGSSSTLQGLERFAPTLSAIGRAVPGVRLKLICDRFAAFPDLPVEPCVWAEADEAREIAACDVGIGWVPDDAWSRGKCGLKVLQYQAGGLPVIANPVGVQADFVRDGETGFRAVTTEEWVNAVRTLAGDVALRARLGATARREVEAGYSVEAGGRRWLDALERLTTRARKVG